MKLYSNAEAECVFGVIVARTNREEGWSGSGSQCLSILWWMMRVLSLIGWIHVIYIARTHETFIMEVAIFLPYLDSRRNSPECVWWQFVRKSPENLQCCGWLEICPDYLINDRDESFSVFEECAFHTQESETTLKVDPSAHRLIFSPYWRTAETGKQLPRKIVIVVEFKINVFHYQFWPYYCLVLGRAVGLININEIYP